MAVQHIYSVKSVKFGTPTGTGTVPDSGDLTALPNTEKGSVVIEESESTATPFYEDQSPYPIENIEQELGSFSLVARFNDIQFDTLATFKGGTGTVSGYEPATGWQTIKKALVIETDSGHTVDFRNAQCRMRITNLGGRDKLASVELKAMPLICADGSAPYKINKL